MAGRPRNTNPKGSTVATPAVKVTETTELNPEGLAPDVAVETEAIPAEVEAPTGYKGERHPLLVQIDKAAEAAK